MKGRYALPYLRAGEVCGCLIVNQATDVAHGGYDRVRPGVLVFPTDDNWSWGVMGLTLSSHYGGGEARVPIPDWEGIPLRQQGYLWGPRLAMVPRDDIRTHIGWAPPSLRQAIVGMCGFPKDRPDLADAFLAAAPQGERRAEADRGTT